MGGRKKKICRKNILVSEKAKIYNVGAPLPKVNAYFYGFKKVLNLSLFFLSGIVSFLHFFCSPPKIKIIFCKYEGAFKIEKNIKT